MKIEKWTNKQWEFPAADEIEPSKKLSGIVRRIHLGLIEDTVHVALIYGNPERIIREVVTSSRTSPFPSPYNALNFSFCPLLSRRYATNISLLGNTAVFFFLDASLALPSPFLPNLKKFCSAAFAFYSQIVTSLFGDCGLLIDFFALFACESIYELAVLRERVKI